jgi:FG-GAP-like repeat
MINRLFSMFPRKLPCLVSALLLGSACAASAASLPTFKKVIITHHFWAEGANYGDFNRDGRIDIVSGAFWYAGPDFKKRHEIWHATASFKRKNPDGTEETIPGFEGALGEKNAYSDCFLTFTYDFNGDGWPDVLVIGFPGAPAAWYENPKGADGPWPRHQVFDQVGDESPCLADVTGDGKPELLCCAHDALGYFQADWQHPDAPWRFHPISPDTPKGHYQKFTHGVGCGDINGDGRADILEKDGWWEQPSSLEGDPRWLWHPFPFAREGAQMLVYDVNGDGLNDVITSLNAHGYGLAWYEQVRTNGAITFHRHLILNPDATPNRYGISFTQLHSLALADIDGDGLMDIVTGKRFWAHGKHGPDPESDGHPAVLYWFQLKRSNNGHVDFIPHLIDNDSGVGTQVTVGYISNPHHPDIVVGNKKGLFVFEQVLDP